MPSSVWVCARVGVRVVQRCELHERQVCVNFLITELGIWGLRFCGT